VAFLVFGALAVPTVALGHIERASYWPDPAPDDSVSPSAGGEVPTVRSLASAVRKHKKKPPGSGKTRVVCQPDSMKLLKESVRDAKAHGYDIRPTDNRSFTKKEARRLKRINRKLKHKCKFSEIQPAVTASGNNYAS